MSSPIKDLSSFSDMNKFLNEVIHDVKVGTFGGRKFVDKQGHQFTMNEIVKKLADITENTVMLREISANEVIELKKVIKDLKELDDYGYHVSRNKKIPLFRRILTTIRQGFGLSEKNRKELFEKIQSFLPELQDARKQQAIVLERPAKSPKAVTSKKELEVEEIEKEVLTPEERNILKEKMKQVFGKESEIYRKLAERGKIKNITMNLDKMIQFLKKENGKHFIVNDSFKEQFFQDLHADKFSIYNYTRAFGNGEYRILRRQEQDVTASNPLFDSNL